MPPQRANNRYARHTATQLQSARRVPDDVQRRLLIDKIARRKMDLVEVDHDWEQWAEEAKRKADERKKKADERKRKKDEEVLEGLMEEEEEEEEEE
jgi:hypothetical protein